MFGAITIPVPTQQESIPPNATPTADDNLPNESSEDPLPMETLQYQLPLTQSIPQHRQHLIFDPVSKSSRTGRSFGFPLTQSLDSSRLV
jgi:hypothetical protein